MVHMLPFFFLTQKQSHETNHIHHHTPNMHDDLYGQL